MRIILASKSPRRREILENLGLKFEIMTADADESSDIKEPSLLVAALAERKGRAVEEKFSLDEDCLVIACDTLVYAESEILGKPRDREDAERMIRLLSGKSHKVISGLYLSYKGKSCRTFEETQVRFAPLDESEIEDYINGSEPYDKAGGYGIQGKASLFISGIDGDYFNVVGLPVPLLYRTLKEEFGIKLFNI